MDTDANINEEAFNEVCAVYDRFYYKLVHPTQIIYELVHPTQIPTDGRLQALGLAANTAATLTNAYFVRAAGINVAGEIRDARGGI